MLTIVQRCSPKAVSYTHLDVYKRQVSSIPFPMLLIDQFGNIVMHNNIASLCMSHLEPLTYLDNPFVHGVREFIKDAFILERDMDKICLLYTSG